jgi:predicted nucleic acid-binding protein
VSRVAIPRAVIDADVLYRRHPRNLLVWHALAGLFELHWSARIVEETRRHLVERNVAAFGEAREHTVARTLRRVTDALTTARAGSLVPEEEIAAREPSMPNDAKDRHVLAAAVACAATVVVTTNVRDFAAIDTRPQAVAAMTPDAFLTACLDASTSTPRWPRWSSTRASTDGPCPELLALLAAGEPDRPAVAPGYVRRIAQLSGVRAAAAVR